jgi:hypothetical protein
VGAARAAAAPALHRPCASVVAMAHPDPSPSPAPTLPDGNRDLILSGVWVAKPLLAEDAFPEALVLTAADRRLASKLRAPVRLCRRRIGAHAVELLLERGEDRSVDLSLRIPTAPTQFKDPYILMEAEPGNTREVGLREVQFHLQGRVPEADVRAADWAGFFAAAARKLEALRGAKGARPKRAPARKPPAKKGRGKTRAAARKVPARKRAAPRRKAPARGRRR